MKLLDAVYSRQIVQQLEGAQETAQQIGASPGAGPLSATERTLTVHVGSNGDCEPGSTIDSTRFQVLNFG